MIVLKAILNSFHLRSIMEENVYKEGKKFILEGNKTESVIMDMIMNLFIK